MNIFNEYFTRERLQNIIPLLFEEFKNKNYNQYFEHILREVAVNTTNLNMFLNFIYELMNKKKFKTIWTLQEFIISNRYLLDCWNKSN